VTPPRECDQAVEQRFLLSPVNNSPSPQLSIAIIPAGITSRYDRLENPFGQALLHRAIIERRLLDVQSLLAGDSMLITKRDKGGSLPVHTYLVYCRIGQFLAPGPTSIRFRGSWEGTPSKCIYQMRMRILATNQTTMRSTRSMIINYMIRSSPITNQIIMIFLQPLNLARTGNILSDPQCTIFAYPLNWRNPHFLA
jgi:hypothetical protein